MKAENGNQVWEIQNIMSWVSSDFIETTDLKDGVGRFLISLKMFQFVGHRRSGESTALNDLYCFKAGRVW
jgi:hypothetical protein